MRKTMVRVQVYLNDDLDRELEKVSYRLGTSKASLVREGVRMLLKEKGSLKDEPLMSLKGAAARSGRKDISERHDAYLAGLKKRHAA